MNLELLARTRDRIAEVGNEHCDMAHWVAHNGGAVRHDGTSVVLAGSGPIDCGTTGCIAGHAVAVARGETKRFDLPLIAQRLLELTAYQANSLFCRASWPQRYDDIARDEGDAKGMLAILDDLLDGTLVLNGWGHYETEGRGR